MEHIKWKRQAFSITRNGKAFFPETPTHGGCGCVVNVRDGHWFCSHHGKIRKPTKDETKKLKGNS